MRNKVSVDELARRQHGVVARPQLLEHGWSPSRIAREREARRLHRIHAGVYAVGHRAVTDRGRWLAAVLACAPDGVLSHESAAALWDLPVRDNGLTRVTAAHRRRRAGIVIHRGDLGAGDVDVRHGIRVTSVARTLADCSHSLDDARFHRAVKEAQFNDLWVDAEIEDVLTRRRSRKLKGYLGDETLTQTELEDRFLRICARHRIPPPVTQYGARPRVDFIWHAERVVVEVDGWQAHGTRIAFQQDRATTNALQLEGFVVLRYTYADVTRRPQLVAGQVRRALGV
jgi:very-short-patch-repair endonuclease